MITIESIPFIRNLQTFVVIMVEVNRIPIVQIPSSLVNLINSEQAGRSIILTDGNGLAGDWGLMIVKREGQGSSLLKVVVQRV